MIIWIKFTHSCSFGLLIASAAAAAKSLQSCPTLCDPMDGIPPGSPVPGILQARTLEWVAISFSNAWKWKVKVKSLAVINVSLGSRRVRHDWATSLSLFTFHFHALEKEIATHSSVLAWRIPGTRKPAGLPSMGLHRVGHDWSDLTAAASWKKSYDQPR